MLLFINAIESNEHKSPRLIAGVRMEGFEKSVCVCVCARVRVRAHGEWSLSILCPIQEEEEEEESCAVICCGGTITI